MEYVEKGALKNLVKEYFKGAIDAVLLNLDTVDASHDIVKLIDGVEKAEVATARRGRWVYAITYRDADTCICSECEQMMTTHHGERMPFCPNCGAKMDGGEDNA